MPSAEGRARYEGLAGAAEAGVVPDELVPSLEALLDLALQKRPLAEPVLSGVFQRTPRGQELATATREVNAALRSLKGQSIQQMHLTAGPRRYAVTIETERVRLSMVLDEAGPRIESVEMG
jgi:hypothetical protein